MTPSTSDDKYVWVVRWTDPRFPASNGVRKICKKEDAARTHASSMSASDKTLIFSVERWNLE
jgi:hypothetical protein